LNIGLKLLKGISAMDEIRHIFPVDPDAPKLVYRPPDIEALEVDPNFKVKIDTSRKIYKESFIINLRINDDQAIK
jgi:hypothetical protein